MPASSAAWATASSPDSSIFGIAFAPLIRRPDPRRRVGPDTSTGRGSLRSSACLRRSVPRGGAGDEILRAHRARELLVQRVPLANAPLRLLQELLPLVGRGLLHLLEPVLVEDELAEGERRSGRAPPERA